MVVVFPDPLGPSSPKISFSLMLNEIPQWKYERDFNYEEGVTTNEGYRYDLWNNSFDDKKVDNTNSFEFQSDLL